MTGTGTTTHRRSVVLGVTIAALLVPTAGHAAGGAAPVRAKRLTLMVRSLPAGRATIGQIAAYYYGAPEMSFVIQNANPRLHHVRTDRRLATLPGLAGHLSIVVPIIRGLRPIVPRA